MGPKELCDILHHKDWVRLIVFGIVFVFVRFVASDVAR